jgi:hypothetical protein
MVLLIDEAKTKPLFDSIATTSFAPEEGRLRSGLRTREFVAIEAD